MSKYLLKNERMHTSCALPDLWFQEIPFWSRIPPHDEILAGGGVKFFFSDLYFYFFNQFLFFFWIFMLRCWYHMLSRLSTTIYYTSGFHIKTIYISQPFGHINFLLYRCKCVNLAGSSLKNLIWYFSPHSDHTQIRRRHAKISNQTCWRDKDQGKKVSTDSFLSWNYEHTSFQMLKYYHII